MYYCYGKGVQRSVLCREVVLFSEGPLSEVPLYNNPIAIAIRAATNVISKGHST